MLTRKLFSTLATLMSASSILAPAAYCQVATTLNDPLIPGQQSSLPFVPPRGGAPAPIGNGSAPLPVTNGMGGAPTLTPWNANTGANGIAGGNSGLGLPFSPSIATPPGALGPLLTPFIPNAPSTAGGAPAYLQAPAGYINPAQQTGVLPGGGLPGTGGYNTSINRIRRGGQSTYQYEERGLNSYLGGGGNSQDEVTELGPLAGFGVPYGIPTGNGYNNGAAFSNNDNRNSSIDLGGGQRLRIGGALIPLGQTIQDYGLSATRGNAIGALSAQQSTDFGQGLRNEPIASYNTTDFGLGYRQFNAANVGYQKTGQLLNPTAIQTNY